MHVFAQGPSIHAARLPAYGAHAHSLVVLAPIEGVAIASLGQQRAFRSRGQAALGVLSFNVRASGSWHGTCKVQRNSAQC